MPTTKNSPGHGPSQAEKVRTEHDAESAHEQVRAEGYSRAVSSRSGRTPPSSPRGQFPTAADIRAAREQRVWHALLHARRQAADARISWVGIPRDVRPL